MTRIHTCLLILCGMSALWLLPAGRCPLPAAEGKAFQQTSAEVKIFEMTNAERKKMDLPPLKLSPNLSKIARAHSDNMARQEKLDHTLDKKDPFDRLRDAGYKFKKAGENVGFGEEGAALAVIMKAWMESKAHAANILLPEFSEIGVGIAIDKNKQTYYTQLFAKPRP